MRPSKTRNIGVTGITLPEQFSAISESFTLLCEKYYDDQKETPTPRLMTGVLVSDETINEVSNRCPSRYPPLKNLGPLFQKAESEGVLCLAHYNTENPQNILDECENVLEKVGPSLKGFQLNLRWPDPGQIVELRRRHPNLYLLLQIGSRALSDCAGSQKDSRSYYDANELVSYLKSYESCLNGVLLDPSGGRGKLLEAYQLQLLVNVLNQGSDTLDIGVAGGLSSETITILQGLSWICPRLSIDAEGKLRNTKDDSLSLSKVEAYLEAALKLFYQERA